MITLIYILSIIYLYMIKSPQFELVKTKKILKYLAEIEKNKIYSNFGPLYFKLKKRIQRRLNYRNNEIIFTSSGHSALLAITKYLRSITKKKYVLCPSYSFFSNPLSIIDAGFIPIFVDIDEKDLMVDIQLTKKILKKKKEIAFLMVLSPLGHKVDITYLNHLSKKIKLPIVYDAADNFLNLNKNITNNKIFITTSFHPTKTFGGNESGMIITPSKHANSIKDLINFGKNKYIGFNGKFSEYDAAILLANYDQLKKREKKLKSIHKIFSKKLNKNYTLTDLNNYKSNKLFFYSKIRKIKIQKSLDKFKIKLFNLWSNKSMHEFKIFQKYKKTRMRITNLTKKKLYTFYLNESFPLKKFSKICLELNNLE